MYRHGASEHGLVVALAVGVFGLDVLKGLFQTKQFYDEEAMIRQRQTYSRGSIEFLWLRRDVEQ